MKLLPLSAFFNVQKILTSGVEESLFEEGTWFPIGVDVGLGAVVGFSIGYFLKKISKVVLFLLGFFVLTMVILSRFDIVVIQWETLEVHFSSQMEEVSGIRGLMTMLVSWLKDSIPLGAGLVVGFWTGFKVG